MRTRARIAILIGLVGLLVGIAAGCRTSASRPGEFELTKGTSKVELVSTNGIWTNGLSTNGIWTNGIWTNGIWTNGIWTNGIWTNGIWTNGVSTNGIWTNGIWTNGIWTNGIWTNGIWTNGIWTNGIWTNGIWTNGIWTNGIWTNGIWTNGLAGDTLKSNKYTRQLLEYVYACAMPAAVFPEDGGAPTSYDTTLDPNNGTLACSPQQPCDAGYTCSSSNTCVIPLTGAIGLGINADGSTWWGSGTCDESCQRWVSACVLARTNAYGVHVKISMRAPANAPQAIKDALAVSDLERNGDNADNGAYSLREGAYYGNIFSTTPGSLGASGNFVPSTDGTTASVIEESPAFFACAGPGSNIPEITKRFCSSQGDQVVIKVPGVCLATATEAATCSGEDTDPTSPTFGAIQHCYTSTSATSTNPCSNPSDPTCYDQVITVYLQQPIAVCGNAVCETGENDASSSNYCPSDCHPGGWAKDYAPNLELNQVNTTGNAIGVDSIVGMSAVGPDDTIVVAGTPGDLSSGILTPSDIDLGGGILSASQGWGVLAKYHSDGSYAWGVRFGNTSPAASGGQLQRVSGVTVTPNGNITVIGLAYEIASPFGTGTEYETVWISTYTADGVLVGTSSVPMGCNGCGMSGPPFNLRPTRAFAVDSQGNVVLAAAYSGVATIGSTTLIGLNGPQTEATFIAKVSPQGNVLWAQAGEAALGEGVLVSGDVPLSLVVDSADNIVYIDGSGASGGGGLQKLSPDGSLLWSRGAATSVNQGGAANYTPGGNATYTVAAVDASGNVYAGGWFSGSVDFGAGRVCDASSNPFACELGIPPFIAKYDPDGSFQWVSYPIIPPTANFGLYTYGAGIGFDPAGNVLLASFGDPSIGGGINFGVGTFPTYGSPNIFLSAYSPDVGRLRWAKQIPTILSSSLLGMAIDSQGRVIVSGNYSGSMQVDDRLLVTGVPEQPGNIDSFLASFDAPPTTDTTPPAIGDALDQTGVSLNTAPSNIVAQATSSAGAVVFFMPPTAIDTGYAGTNVACSPPPNTTFPIGTTTVTCTASDPLGNSSTATFTVTIVDTLPPLFSPVSDVTVQATSASGAIVPYPTAIDQVDGSITPTCTPAPSSVLPVGKTTVQCTATDAHNNQSQATFVVTVTPGTFCTTCSAQGATCGTISDGCGGMLSCGSCTAPQTCGGAGAAKVCGCAPTTCSAQGATCGSIPDGCGNTLNCGSCAAPQTCGGGGTPNACGCTPTTCAALGATCGSLSNGCGGVLSCGSCTAPQTCGGGGAMNACGCRPTTCSAQGAACGSISDGCGGTLNCGACPAPKLTLPGTITATATSASGATVTYSASATDPVDGSIVPVCKPVSGSAFALGTTTVSCTATNSHGIQATGSFQVQVQYAWSGILQPINADGSSVFKLGSTVPVKFQLTGASAGITNAAATLSLAKISSNVVGTDMEVVSTSAATTGNAFLYDGQYIFNLNTKGLSKGTWQLSINLGDGGSRTVTISLK